MDTWYPILVVFLLVLALTWPIWLGCVDSGGRGEAFLLPLSLIILAAVFLLFSPSFRGRLRFFYPVVSKVLSEKILKLRSRHQVLGFGATLMLVPLLGHRSTEK